MPRIITAFAKLGLVCLLHSFVVKLIWPVLCMQQLYLDWITAVQLMWGCHECSWDLHLVQNKEASVLMEICGLEYLTPTLYQFCWRSVEGSIHGVSSRLYKDCKRSIFQLVVHVPLVVLEVVYGSTHRIIGSLIVLLITN